MNLKLWGSRLQQPILLATVYVIACFLLLAENIAAMYAGIVLLFALFVTACLRWGKLLAHYNGAADSKTIWLFIGSFAIALAAFLQAWVTLPPALLHVFFPALLLVGANLQRADFADMSAVLNGARADKPVSLALLLLSLLFVERLMAALLPSANPDALYYHLPAPLSWFEAGGFRANPANPSLQQAGLWEMLYYSFFAWVPDQAPQRLVIVQVLAQLTHIFVGGGGCLLVLRRFAERQVSSSALAWLIAAFASLTFFHFDILVTAKNDLGVSFWLLAGLLLLTMGQTRQRILACFLVGAAMTAKWSLLVFPFVYLILFYAGRHRREIPLALLAGLIGALPMMVRYWWFTGNPFFPLLQPVFGAGGLSPTVQEFYAALMVRDNLGSLSHFVDRMSGLVTQNPVNIALPFLFIYWKRLRDSVRLLAIAALICLPFYYFLIGDIYVNWRMAGALNSVMALCGALALVHFVAGQHQFARLRSLIIVAVAATFLVVVRPWVSLSHHLPFLAEPVNFLDTHQAGSAIRWLNRLEPGTPVATSNFNRFYHVRLPIIKAVDADPQTDSRIREINSPMALLDYLILKRFRYFLVVKSDGLIQGRAAAMMMSLADQARTTVVHFSDDSYVIDLEMLAEAAASGQLKDVDHDWQRVNRRQQ